MIIEEIDKKRIISLEHRDTPALEERGALIG